MRRSTDEEHQPYSIEAQDEKLAHYIESQPGWELTKRFPDDASGATTERPGLQRALAAARAGLIDVLLVYRVDRFSRRLRDLVDLLEILTDAGVSFRSATEPFDTFTPLGRLLVQLLGMFAEFERETIIDRVINGMERQAAAGRWKGGYRPYGYTPNSRTQILEPMPDETPIVTTVFRLYTQDRIGTRAIGTVLNERGHRTSSGGPWSGHQIARMLSNRIYLGEINFRGITTENAHEAVTDRDTFDLAQQILAARGEDYSRRASNSSEYLLTGRIRCPECGKSMIGTAAHGRNKVYRYYTCFTRARYGTDKCGAQRFNAEQLDAAVLAALAKFYTQHTDLIAQAIEHARKQYANVHDERSDEHTATQREITKTNTALERYLTSFENGTMSEQTCAPRIELLTTKLGQLAARRDELAEEPTVPDPVQLGDITTNIGTIISAGNPSTTKALIEALVAEVKITGPNQIVPVFRIPQPCGSTDTTILHRHGVQVRRRSLTSDQVDEAIYLYNLGWSLARVGGRLGVDATTVRNRLRERGVRTRNAQGRPRS